MKTKSFLKTSGIVVIVCIAVAAVYMLYFYTIGVPKTQAREYYNLAMTDLQSGERNKAIEELQKALTYWHEGYIQDKLNEIQ